MVQKIQEAAKPKGYVPPHARGRTDYKVSLASKICPHVKLEIL